MEGKGNPADDAIRGLDPRKETLSSRWLTGPAFFWQIEELCEVTYAGDDDPGIKNYM